MQKHRNQIWRFALISLFSLSVLSAAAQPPMGGPPPEASEACAGKQQGTSCQFTTPRGELTGSCRSVPEGTVCVPINGGIAPRIDARNRQGSEMSVVPQGRSYGRVQADIIATTSTAFKVTSRIPDTQQGNCFDNNSVISCPQAGQDFAGQDAQYNGAKPNYRINGDGTITDLVTQLVWQQAHNTKRLGWNQAKQACDELQLGGYDDWRLPSIRELYSIADFRGTVGRRPYIDDVFEIHEPDASILKGDRFASSHHTDMMGQTWSSTIYTGDHWDRKGVQAAFFMNFLDGHIKQAPIQSHNGLFYRCVHGPSWGENKFVDHHNATVTDKMSGLTWQQADDGQTRNWREALAYCEGLNLADHDDWRLPNVKELQSIVDYSQHDPALNQKFFKQSNHAGWFWSSTTHGDSIRQAEYICFGKCTSVDGVDVHGAGAQRSDPKYGSATMHRSQGGQNDEIRINNYVRCVR